MPQRKCTKSKVNVSKPCKRITLPIEWELYEQLIQDSQLIRAHLDQMIDQSPELFPTQIAQGYCWHDKRTSKKLPGVSLRRVKLNALDEQGRVIVVTIAPRSVLHAFLKIRDRCQHKFQTVYPEIKQQVWDIYAASDPDQFKQRLIAFKRWSQAKVTGAALEAITKLCVKADSFLLAFDHPAAYPTSNIIDRHMEPMARWLFSARFFHGHWSSAEKQIRAWALFHNFWPYCPRTKIYETYQSPAHRLNKRVYHDNWLHNQKI